ncbi:MAG: phytanoyl-CoA dioxygenase family protein [Parvibaculum sp.]|nr:phytanoyl-CoA dioxygenase family protein [Parvibaculum sp.]|tara:strand:- start:35382 stop:36221 length:840 start_codon:yes stop_codon:yes gene_type:complete
MRDELNSALFDSERGFIRPRPFGAEIAPLSARDLFKEDQRAERLFGGELGCRQGPTLRSDEVARIAELIKEHLVRSATSLGGKASELISGCALEQYHSVASQFDHQSLLSKIGRILSKEAVEEIRTMSLFRYLADGLGDIALADEDGVGYDQICMRVVRPNVREDVGFLHCDNWFWEYYQWPTPEKKNRLKVWVPICIDATENGLVAVPGSHQQALPYKTKVVGHKVGFEPGFEINGLDYRLFDRPAGTAFLFNYYMLHVGAMNTTPNTRVSIEFTVLY